MVIDFNLTGNLCLIGVRPALLSTRTPEVQNRSHTITLRGAANTLKSGDLKTSTEDQQFRVLATADNQGDTADEGLQGGGLVALDQELPENESVCGCSSTSDWEWCSSSLSQYRESCSRL